MEVDEEEKEMFSASQVVEVKFREIQNAQKNFRLYEKERFTNSQNKQYLSQLVQLMEEKRSSEEEKHTGQVALQHYFNTLDQWCLHLN